MGHETPLTIGQDITRRTSTKAEAARRPLRLGIDVPLLLIVSTLLVFGLLMVYSASWDYSSTFMGGGDLRQIAFLLVLGLIVGWIVLRFHPTGSQRLSEYLISIKDLTHAPMHLSRSLEALVKGGWLGVG